MPIAALAIGGIGSILGGVFSSNASSKAASTQAAAAEQAASLQHQDAQAALDFQKQVYGDQKNLISPYAATGTAGLNALAFRLGLRVPQQSTTATPRANLPNLPPQFNRANFLASRAGGTNPLANDPNLGTLPPSIGGGRFQPIQDGTADGGGFSANSGFTPRTSMAFDGNGLINGGINPGNNATGTLPNPDIGSFNPGSPGDGTSGGLMTGNGAVSASTGGAVNADGSPGMVPRTDGGGQGASASSDPAGFGSLLQPFGETFHSPTDVTEQNDPGYQFRLKQGEKALQNSAAARGSLLTGGTAKAITNYGQDYASNEFSNVYNRASNEFLNRYNIYNQDQNTVFNRLAAISGIGQTATGQLANAGGQAANNTGNILMTSGQQIGQQINNAAAARASGYIGSANAYSSIPGNLLNTLSVYNTLNQ